MPERVVLEGRVVRLDPLELSDVDELLAAAIEDRSTYGFTLVPDDAPSMHAYVSIALDDERSGWALPFVVRALTTGRVVGSARYLDLEYWTSPPAWPPGRPSTGGTGTPSVVEIGSTWLAASAQRTGINTETKLLMLRHAFAGWGVERVTFKTDARNTRSRQSIERVGAQFEGIRRAHARATDGSVRNSAYYSILQSEWPAVEQALLTRLARVETS